MEHRLTKAEIEIEHLKKQNEKIEEMVDKHETACEVHAPKAESAHNGVINMSKELAVISTIVKSMTDSMDEFRTRNVKADEKSDKILEELAELRGEKRFGGWFGKLIIGLAGTFVLWSASEILSLHKELNSMHKHKMEKAIKRDASQEDNE